MSNYSYDRRVNDAIGVTVFILAGGKSSRMGSDKAFVKLEGETLLAKTLTVARAVTEEVRIVGDAGKFSAFGPVVEDVYRDQGPMGGIHAALSTSPTNLNLILAVDLPFVEANFLRYLLSRARESGAMVTLPRAAQHLQPLCAIYQRAFAAVAEESLRNGRNKIDSLFGMVRACVIEEEELIRGGFSSAIFRNLNTPDDLEKARSSQIEHRAE
jgi:molybdopterin-guanine dinucleotide biosynthesis protein A